MITYELQEEHDTEGREARGRGDVPGRSGAVRRPVPSRRRSRPARGARPVTRGRRAGAEALCPSPVPIAARRAAEPAAGPLRRALAGIGLALASAVAVFGLGQLAEVASAGHADAPQAPMAAVATGR